MLMFKVAVVCAALLLVYVIVRTVWYGRHLRRLSTDSMSYRIVLRQHRAATTRAVWMMVFTVLLLEGGIRAFLVQWESVPILLMYTHLPLATLFLLSVLCARFWVTGVYSPPWHRFIVYVGLVTGVGAVVTGSVLLYRI